MQLYFFILFSLSCVAADVGPLQDQQICLEKAQQSLDVFAPVSALILKSDKPACGAVKALYSKVKELKAVSGEIWDPWFERSDISEVTALQEGLLKIEGVECSENNELFYLPGQLQGCSMDGIWAEILQEVDCALLGGRNSLSWECFSIASFMESKKVDAQHLTLYFLKCIEAQPRCVHFSCKRVLTARNFVTQNFAKGKKIDFFIDQIKGATHGSGELWARLRSYQSYLQSMQFVNWWSFITGLIKIGARSHGDGSEILSSVYETLMKQGGDLGEALDHLKSVESMDLERDAKEDASDQLIRWLSGACGGISSIWQGSRVRNVTQHKLSNIISSIDRLKESRSEGFWNLMVQSLPPRGLGQWEVLDTADLQEGLYKRVIEGADAIEIISDMLDAGKASANPEGSERAVRNVTSYVHYLSLHHSVAKLFIMLRQVPGKMKESSLVSGLIWEKIKKKGRIFDGTLIAYVKFVILQKELSEEYAQKEIMEACALLRQTGFDNSARRFLNGWQVAEAQRHRLDFVKLNL